VSCCSAQMPHTWLNLSLGVVAGWCIFNDLAVAARVVQQQHGVGQVLFVDLDVHQGDGTATIFQADKSVYTFSMHCKEQPFPLVVQESDFDVGLAAGTADAEYLRVSTLSPAFMRVLPPSEVGLAVPCDLVSELGSKFDMCWTTC
jgi:acetoin utilization deacetylase AcuC-like enzyme